jgi:putative transposase
MIAIELKCYPTLNQRASINEAIRTTQFIRNKALRLWMDAPKNNTKVRQNDLYKLSATLAKEYPFVQALNSTARQASTERTWNGILRFYKHIARKPKFQKDNRSVEFKQSGWKLSEDNKRITFNSYEIGSLRLKGTRNLEDYSEHKINRVRIVKRADGYYVQFLIDFDRKVEHTPTGKWIGIDVGLKDFLTDSEGHKVPNPRFLRRSEKKLKRCNRRMSKCKKRSKNRDKARKRLALKHLQVSRQRKDYALKSARQIITNSDFVGIEDLKIKNLIRNRKVSKSFADAGLRMFRNYLEYYGSIYGVPVVAVPPQYTSQMCSDCGKIVQKTLSERTHVCSCGCLLDRDENAAINILGRAIELVHTVGHTEMGISDKEYQTLLENGPPRFVLLVQNASLFENSDEEQKEESAGL